MTILAECNRCKQTFFPNQLKEKELFGIIFTACKDCIIEMENAAFLKLQEFAFKGLPHGQQQRIKKERAAVYAGSDFDMVDA